MELAALALTLIVFASDDPISSLLKRFQPERPDISDLPPTEQCFVAAAAAERKFRTPSASLQAITLVETGRRMNGEWVPWPWTINVDGKGRFFDDAITAMIAAEEAAARGSSVDVGCFQVNLRWHGHKRNAASLFDPLAGAAYAASYLKELRGEAGSWQGAAGMYHSRDTKRAIAYQRRWKTAKSSDAVRSRARELRRLSKRYDFNTDD